MASGIWPAAAGATARMYALDVSTSNLVNAHTPGYRAEAAVFRQALNKAGVGGSVQSVEVRTSEPDMKMGQIISTGGQLDVAIPDEVGFFTLQTPAGPLYTRAGNFKLAVDGTLVSSDGKPLLATDSRPIQVPAGAGTVSINSDGTVIVDAEPHQTLALVRFSNPAGLEKVGDVAFKARPEAGRPIAHQVRLETGALELSNEDTMSGMSDEVLTSREFEMTMRVVEAFREIERSAANKIMNK